MQEPPLPQVERSAFVGIRGEFSIRLELIGIDLATNGL